MTIGIGRRQFISALGAAAVTWPLAARAQATAKLPTIGFLGSASASSWSPYVAAFTQRLHELGWIEGQTVAIEYRWAEGRSERLAEIAAEFVALTVSVIVTQGTPAVVAAKQATSVIPIVFASAGDPVGSGLVASLARPGSNVTGLSSQTVDTAGKRLALMREVVPGFHRMAILANVDNPLSVEEMAAVQAAARTFGLEADTLGVRHTDDFAPAIAAQKGRAEALYVCLDPLVIANEIHINTLALSARLPSTHDTREGVEAGGLMSYGPSQPGQFRRAADYVDKILRGAKPGDMPVEQPTKFDLVVNLKTAKALGLTIPHNLIVLADEVIE